MWLASNSYFLVEGEDRGAQRSHAPTENLTINTKSHFMAFVRLLLIVIAYTTLCRSLCRKSHHSPLRDSYIVLFGS